MINKIFIILLFKKKKSSLFYNGRALQEFGISEEVQPLENERVGWISPTSRVVESNVLEPL